MKPDLVVCGLGPAGRALAHRAVLRGLTVIAVDPAPERRWTATYAMWADELPGWLPPQVVGATVSRPMAWGTRAHRLDRPYVVLDTARLQTSLHLGDANVVSDRAIQVGPGHVTLASGTKITGGRVIDARGLTRSPARAEQTAYGVIVDVRRCAGLDPLFMDWRPDNGAAPGDPPSFLYAVPLDGERMLLEETCLAGRPALTGAHLRTRLRARLHARNVPLAGDEPVEHVRFPVQGGRPGPRRFGAAGGFLHPATGYSVGAALAAADAVAAGQDVWPATARIVHRLRGAGLRALLALPPGDLPLFFDTFFALPPDAQRAYLSGRTDLAGTVTAMSALFAALPGPLRRRVAAATLGVAVPSRGRRASAMMGG
ncbi:lycopene cyclase family protein [Nocardia implantans]|uniref:Lycopene cyclase family protein n=1 Tax=Nocardia implantans TaxID=3108168 RepID=A0ABU6AUE8_9NOCA|nr:MULTISPECIES: lycopene cyclase family protein [unclassified Nocardia]MEA3527407.1 lycopene cyclase family protein [Nocardia sp. CDC192]MEB3511115.1 lycopene cyclase family protein [Nocardia sp. CDC186]